MAPSIKFDGIEGECNDKDHKGWERCPARSPGGSHKAGAGATGQTRRRGVVTVEDVNISKEYDKSSVKLAEAVCMERSSPRWREIHDTATYGEARAPFLKYELKNVMVSSHNGQRCRWRRRGAFLVVDVAAQLRRSETDLRSVRCQGSQKGSIEMTWKVEEGER